MLRPYHTAPHPDCHCKREPILKEGFDYSPLAAEVAERVQPTAQRIRLFVQRTMEEILTVGQALLEVKEALPHGWFRIWLHAEFDWDQRTAGRFMAVAQRFGSKIDTMSIMRIDLAAAYSPLVVTEGGFYAGQTTERLCGLIRGEIVLGPKVKECPLLLAGSLTGARL